MREQGVYQQLRSHLAYLRLGAVAEQLAPALQQAEQEKLSHTRFLERLLALEVEATERRRLEGRLRFASFPSMKKWDRRVGVYRFYDQKSAVAALKYKLKSQLLLTWSTTCGDSRDRFRATVFWSATGRDETITPRKYDVPNTGGIPCNNEATARGRG